MPDSGPGGVVCSRRCMTESTVCGDYGLCGKQIGNLHYLDEGNPALDFKPISTVERGEDV